MCGLIGVVTHDGHPERPRRAQELREAMGRMLHRGTQAPQFQDTLQGIMGHVRLPIVGQSTDFSQPYRTPDGFLAFVGEVHNFKSFGVHAYSDVPLVARHAYDPTSGFKDFDGFWSTLWFPDRTYEASATTDYLGQKPLYVRSDIGAVCSELPPLLRFHPYPVLDELYLANVAAFGYDPTGRTPYEGIWRVPAGAEVVIHSTNKGPPIIRTRRYWPRWIDQPYPGGMSPADLQDVVISSVLARMVSDLPVALLLSGGLDSTIIAACLSMLGADVQAFHVPNEEAEYAVLAAKTYGIPLRELPLEFDPEAAQEAYAEPIDLGSVAQQHALGKALKKEGFHVALSGDGADELFGGYSRASRADTQHSDVFGELPNYHLPRLDTTMMRSTVELRCPFLSPTIIATALRLPWHLRKAKEFLKLAFRRDVPDAILNRPKKPLRAIGADPRSMEQRQARIDAFRSKHGRDARQFR